MDITLRSEYRHTVYIPIEFQSRPVNNMALVHVLGLADATTVIARAREL